MGAPVRIENLVKRFGNVAAVDKVSLEVAAGEIFFLLGPSGCGKTTLLRCVAGFCRPDHGRVSMAGKDITGLPPERRDASMVFQSYALWPHMTVRQNVAFGLEMRGVSGSERTRRTDEALSRVRMRDFAERRPAQLSGGQQQRVALARALVVEPRCLLLDEPLSNLDAKLRLEMRLEIRSLCRSAGLTALYVTHDQKEALSIADRLAVMRDGRMEQVGRPHDVYRRPVNAFVAGFMGETNLLSGRIVSVGDDHAVRVDTRAGGLMGLWAGNRDAPVPGMAVTVSIRPECLCIGQGRHPEDNRMAGEVEETVFLGETVQYCVRIASVNGEALQVRVLEANPDRIRSRGDAVPLSSKRADTLVLLAADS